MAFNVKAFYATAAKTAGKDINFCGIKRSMYTFTHNNLMTKSV